MKSRIRKCCECGKYTLSERCPECKGNTFMPIPPRFSPEDPYGKYRRMLRRQKGFWIRRCGDDGKG